MNDLILYNFESEKVRVIGDKEHPLFVGVDVCRALGYSRPWDAISQHVDEEDTVKRSILTPGGQQEAICLTESGVYSLIFGSKLEQAKRFKRWVTSEVLPSLRIKGCYFVEPRIDYWPVSMYEGRYSIPKGWYNNEAKMVGCSNKYARQMTKAEIATFVNERRNPKWIAEHEADFPYLYNDICGRVSNRAIVDEALSKADIMPSEILVSEPDGHGDMGMRFTQSGAEKIFDNVRKLYPNQKIMTEEEYIEWQKECEVKRQNYIPNPIQWVFDPSLYVEKNA